MKTKLPLVAAIILGIVAAIAVQRFISRQVQAKTAGVEETHTIVVAASRLPQGHNLKESDVKPGSIPKSLVREGMLDTSNYKDYVNQPLATTVDRERVLLKSDFAAKAYTLPTKLTAGMRAVTIDVSQEGGLAGLIQPGDRVDVMVTYQDQGTGKGGAEMGMRTALILPNMEIMATDNQTFAVSAFDDKRGYSTVTICATPEQALRIVNAKSQGSLYLALRSKEDIASPVPRSVNIREELTGK